MKNQAKKQPRSFFGYRRINLPDDSRASDNDPMVHKFTPVGIGRMMPLREKFESAVGDPFLVFNIKNKQRKIVINPLFDLLALRQLNTEYLNETKQTMIEAIVLSDLSVDSNKDKQQALKEYLDKLFSQSSNKNAYQGERKERLKQYQQLMDVKKKQCLAKLQQLYKEHGPETITKRGKQFIQQVTEEMAQTVCCIQNMRSSQQYQLYNFYQRFTKEFFGTSFVIERKNGKNIINIKMVRPSTSMDSILTSVRDHVEMRDGNENYREMAIQMVKDMLTELKRFETMAVNEKGRISYEWFSPDTVIFDQTKLMPKLSPNPILNQFLGIKLKPMSIETRIAFEPTPKEFDHFQSSYQLQHENKLILNDPFYGNIELYDNDKLNGTLNDVKGQQDEIQKLKEMMVVDRFLLSSHFNVKGFEFGRLKNATSCKSQEKYFRQNLKKKKNELQHDMSKLSEFFDFENKSKQKVKFNFLLSEILQFLSLQVNDSFVQIGKYSKILKHTNIRNTLIRELIRNLVSQTFFTRIYNVKKYIFMFLIIVVAILQQSNKLISSERMKPGERKNIRAFLQNAKKIRTEKNHTYYLENTFTRIKDYKSRDKVKDIQSKYLNEEELGQKSFEYIKELYNQIIKLNKLNQGLNEIESSTERTEENNRKYSNLLNQTQTCIKVNYEKSKTILQESIHLELKLKHKDGPHKIAEQHSKIRDYFVYYTRRLQLLFHTFLTINQNNLITYQSLILPLLKIQDHDDAKKIEIPKVYTTSDQDQQIFKTIEEFFDIKKNSSRKMQYLAKVSDQDPRIKKASTPHENLKSTPKESDFNYIQSKMTSNQVFQLPASYQEFQDLFSKADSSQAGDYLNTRQ